MEGMFQTAPFRLQHDPPEAPVPVGAVWDQLAQVLTISFDKQLVAAVLDVSNWSLAYNPGLPAAATPIGAESAGDEVLLTFTGVSGTLGDVTYDPPPFDVVGVNGAAVEAFSMLV
jgi:hypothetical protein